MGLGDLFKSDKERAKEEAKRRRKAMRDAQNALDTVKERVAKLKKERDEQWREARRYLADGQKAAAQRSLQSCRAGEVMCAKLEAKRWVFEQLLTKLEMAKTDQEFASCIKAVNDVVQIDPETVDEVLSEVEDKLGEQVDVDKIWEKMHAKEMEGVSGQMTDVVPSIDDMMTQLQDEVAEDIVTERPASARAREAKAETGDAAKAPPSTEGRMGEARKRIREGLDGAK